MDGGRSVGGFPCEFQRATKRNSVDVLVCTHNDADHANGIAGFLQSGLSCKEVWLPASWTDRLDDLILRPGHFTEELARNILESGEGNRRNLESEGTYLEQLVDDYAEGGRLDELPERIETNLLVERALEGEIQEELGGLDRSHSIAWHPIWVETCLREWWLVDRNFRLFLESIEAAERIRQIALLAYHRGCLIRWFEYTASGASGGIPGRLIPVNACEVVKVQLKRWTALMYLALSVSNRESLVFCSPRDNDPGILFTADSDLRFSNSIPWHNEMIITAPHHGSEANAAAYQRFDRETKQTIRTIWVRSDGRFRKRPGRSYLSLKASRFCTICRGSQQPKQDLQFTSGSQQWQAPATRGCSCI